MSETVQKKIMVVDDEPDVASLLTLMLEAQGYLVVLASDGQEALDMARQEKPDLVLLDVMLPRLNGYKVARMLKFDEKYRHVPIILLTAKTSDKDRAMGLEAGVDDYITKPFDTDKLISKVQEILSRKK